MFRAFLLYFCCACLLFSIICACSSPAPGPSATAVLITPLSAVSSTPTVVSPAVAKTTLTPTAVPACSQISGRLVKGEIKTPMLYKPMRYIVYLPPCYDASGEKSYPVLYLFHGQGYAEDQWVRLGVQTRADALISSGKLPPFLVVMPFDYSYKQPTEYAFEEVFLRALIPTIQKDFRVRRGRENRAIGGLSRGGAWALHIGMRNPALFGSIGGHSAAIFVIDEKALRSRTLAVSENIMPRIWLDAGDHDSELALIGGYEQFLTEHKVSHEWHVYTGWHEEKYWSSHLDQYLSWYARVWK